jgi:hypothetical protein
VLAYRAVIPAGDERTPDGRAHAVRGPSREQLLDVAIDEGDAALVVAVQGELDALTAPRLTVALNDAFARLAGRSCRPSRSSASITSWPSTRV